MLLVLAALLHIRSATAFELAAHPSERVNPPKLLAPGPAPVLQFRLLEAAAKHRVSGLDLVLDDAGH